MISQLRTYFHPGREKGIAHPTLRCLSDFGLSGELIAQELGVSTTTVSFWKVGRVKVPSSWEAPLLDLLKVVLSAALQLRREYEEKGIQADRLTNAIRISRECLSRRAA